MTRRFPKMLSPSQLAKMQGFGSPPIKHFTTTPPPYASPVALRIEHFPDDIVWTIGCNVWTSSGAHYKAQKLCRDKETVRKWQAPDRVEALKDGSFIKRKERERLREFEERLASIGIVRNVVIGSDNERQSFFGYRVAFDDRLLVAELSKRSLDWSISVPKAGPNTFPAFGDHALIVSLNAGHLSGPTFELVDCGAVIWVSILVGFHSQQLEQRAVLTIGDAIDFGTEVYRKSTEMIRLLHLPPRAEP